MSPFPSYYGNKYILVVVEYFSKWSKTQALPTNDAKTVCKFLKKLFSRFGFPRPLINDRGIDFRSTQVEKGFQCYRIQHRLSTTYHS